MNNPSDILVELQAAHTELSQGKAVRAIDRLLKAKVEHSSNVDLEHLLALSYKSIGDVELSKQHFKKCLAIDWNQAEVHNNLANLLKSIGQFDDVEKHYLQALNLQENYVQARRNLAIFHQSQTRYEQAIVEFNRVITHSPEDVSAITGIADCFRFLQDYQSANTWYEKALKLAPQRLNTLHNLGLNYHLQGELSEAIALYKKAYSINSNLAEVVESLAMAYVEIGEINLAINVFQAFVNANPENVVMHERFNEMLWETEYADQYCKSYEKTVLANNGYGSHALAVSHATMLYRAGKVIEASNVLNAKVLEGSSDPRVLSLRGEIEAEQGNYDLAYQLLSNSLKAKFNKKVSWQMVKIDIILQRYAQAQSGLDELFRHTPNCQLTWALQSLVWRLCEDSRYSWLCDYNAFIKTYELDVPTGCASLQDFLLAIKNEVEKQHLNDRAPLSQTLKNGTQTAARLLHTPSPALNSLKTSLRSIVAEYIDSLEDDPDHPFLSRKSEDFEFSGSWSVKLSANGFHVNHVHPDGWISSSCYITIPESIINSSTLTGQQGRIKFGESPLNLGEREVIAKTIQPKQGMVVLFPSYFWHGTYPFQSEKNEVRITTPFDVIPL